jgi:adenosylmethionine-8-amino-7-oxononanoate aminotransferase
MSESTTELDHRHLWHPFTQQGDWCQESPLVIDHAEGTDLFDAEGRSYIDGVSSLWCNVHGHRHPLIDQALRDQLDRVAHSTMLGLTHPGAAELAARLIELAPPGLQRVFYSESGSTAVEIALKMAFQYWRQRGSGPRSSASPTATTATRSARSRSAASTSSTAPSDRFCSRPTGSTRATRESSSGCSSCTAARSPR